MGGEEHCRALLHEAAREADLILIEGVMGLFDGTPSCADLAQLFGIPVLAVIDAESRAQTFGAISHGLATNRKELPFAGVHANRVAGARHAEMTEQGMPPGMTYWGAATRDSGFELPDRHLGLVQAEEVGDLEQRLDGLAAALRATKLTQLPPVVEFAAPKEVPVAPQPILSAMGAELAVFSPLADAALPEVDCVYLPGGYPELHLSQLSANLSMAAALRRHVDAGKPVYAECGGMLYLLESLTDVKGQRADMTGIVTGTATMLFWFLL